MGTRWYYLSVGQQQGPFDLETIRDLVLDGTVRPDTYVWADGMPDWMRAREVPALIPPQDLRPHTPAWIGIEVPDNA